MTLLNVRDLYTTYQTNRGKVHAIEGVNLSLERDEMIGIVGESGSGKSTLAKSILRTLPRNAKIESGSINFDGIELTEISDKQFQKYRWEDIAVIPQSAMNSLDPVYTVGRQFVQVIRKHRPNSSESEARNRAEELFDLVGLEQERLDDYPHQFSGGMKQRAMIALALTLDPKLIIADEPTTALDVINQKNILDNIDEIMEEQESSIMLITHDISVVAERCDKIAVFYGGRIVEYADAETIINRPRHPYTIGLRNAFPSLEDTNQQLTSIPGTPPSLVAPEDKCRFTERCPFDQHDCHSAIPELREVEEGHLVECIRYDEEVIQTAKDPQTWLEPSLSNKR